MGETRATFNVSGKELIVIKLLRVYVRGEAMRSALSLNLIGAS